MNLTPRQKQVYDFLKAYIENQGFAPSYDEIMDKLGIASKSNVSFLLRCLEEKRLIKIARYQHRGITIASPENTPTPKMVNAGRMALLEFTKNDFQYRPETVALRVYERMREAQ